MQQFHNGNVMIAVIKLEVELILQPDKQNVYQNTSYFNTTDLGSLIGNIVCRYFTVRRNLAIFVPL